MMEHEYLHGCAFVKKSGDKIQIFETPYGLGDFAPVLADGTTKPRMLKDRFADVVNVKDFGAVGDGVHDDTAAIQGALNVGRTVFIPEGVYLCSSELELVTEGQRVIGAGMGSGYLQPYYEGVPYEVVSQVTHWKDCTTLLFKGAGLKRVRTRVRYRASAEDPQDNPLSVCVNVQAEGVRLENFTIKLWCERPSDLYADDITNLGADWDVGLFIGSRGCFSASNLGVIGYHRQANVWVDSTQGLGMPRFNSLSGTPYPESTGIQNGTDYFVLERVHTSGGLWGLKVQGCKQKDDGTERLLPYYDELLGRTTTDYRGGYGASDFLMIGCQFFGGNHHTQRRFFDMPAHPNPETDDYVGGSYYIDGFQGNAGKAIHGHRYISCRFMSFAPFNVYLGRTARDLFLGCMIESPQSYVRKNDGSVIGAQSEKTQFGALYLSPRHDSVRLIGTYGSFFYTYSTVKKSDMVLGQDYPDANDYAYLSAVPRVYLTHHLEDGEDGKAYLCRGTGSALSGLYFGPQDNPTEFYISNLSQGESGAKVRLGAAGVKSESDKLADGSYRKRMLDIATSSSGVTSMQFPGSLVLETRGALTITGGDDGQSTLGVFYKGGTFEAYGPVRPNADGTWSLGIPSYRWSNVYASTGSINTSDERAKTGVTDPDEALMRAWGKVNFKVFQFKDALERKGADARLHVGVIAQQVIEAFASERLDATRYGLLCYDKWEDRYEDIEIIDQVEVADEEGRIITPQKTHIEHRLVTPAGDRYGIRYEEALALEAAYQRWRMDKLEAALIEKGVKL